MNHLISKYPKPTKSEIFFMVDNAVKHKIEPLRLFSTEVEKITEGKYKGFYQPKHLIDISKPIGKTKDYIFYKAFALKHRKRGKFKCFVMVYGKRNKEKYLLVKVPITLVDYAEGPFEIDIPIMYPLINKVN